MIRRPIDWDRYLAQFHASFPGITEDILGRCEADELIPYQWLTDQIEPAARVLDVGCGSGPARPVDAARWVGIDRSACELERARGVGRRSLVRGDAVRLPIADSRADVVTCSMAMMLVHPIGKALGEVSRVLKPTGELRLLLPTHAPLTTTDRVKYGRLFWAARSTTKFPPSPMRAHATKTLESADFEVSSDERRRFEHRIGGPTDADRFIDSWYLPNANETLRSAARDQAASMAPFTIGIPLRRIIARPR